MSPTAKKHLQPESEIQQSTHILILKEAFLGFKTLIKTKKFRFGFLLKFLAVLLYSNSSHL